MLWVTFKFILQTSASNTGLIWSWRLGNVGTKSNNVIGLSSLRTEGLSNPMTVTTLLTIDSHNYDVQTLALNSLRVGFPTAKIYVHLNIVNHPPDDLVRRTRSRVLDFGGEFNCYPRIHHAEWIQKMVSKLEGRLAIVDGDCIFWKNCENFELEQPLAGMYVPAMHNEFTNCTSFDRLHTSFLYVRDCRELCVKIQHAFKHASHPTYAPYDLFMPCVIYLQGEPIFFDTCSQLYQLIGGQPFLPRELECYDHINSASFYDTMYERLENKKAFKDLHELARTNPSKLRGLYKEIESYYRTQAAKIKLPEPKD